MVEVLATRQAFCFAHKLGFNKLVLEGDSESIINFESLILQILVLV